MKRPRKRTLFSNGEVLNASLSAENNGFSEIGRFSHPSRQCFGFISLRLTFLYILRWKAKNNFIDSRDIRHHRKDENILLANFLNLYILEFKYFQDRY
ncbi:hypothetical protein LR69_01085 [Geobacillus sp. BCO2]|nr:hypothetical protein LR69_01085 [Geobacillus sp. BCO2]